MEFADHIASIVLIKQHVGPAVLSRTISMVGQIENRKRNAAGTPSTQETANERQLHVNSLKNRGNIDRQDEQDKVPYLGRTHPLIGCASLTPSAIRS